MLWNENSLESRLKRIFLFCLLVQIGCCTALLLWLPLLQVVLITVILTLTLSVMFIGLYAQLMKVFRRSGTQMDALQSQDFSILVKPVFQEGIVAEFYQQFDALRESLQRHKSHYNQQLFVLYQMIDHLNTPILVFDHKQRLSYANGAFAELFGRPWQTLRHAEPALLGLRATPEWQFADEQKNQDWQIRLSRFVDQGENNQLLIFINIKTALRNQESEAWQKLIRVLSHEIRNSLTPVAALTQNLLEKAEGEREQQALTLINERCQHLQDFVSRCAEFQQPLNAQPQTLPAQHLWNLLTGLFPEAQLQAKGLHCKLWADPVLLQQVLINLIKNAVEAGSPTGSIDIVFTNNSTEDEIRILDCGQGITNPENLFVPFYSTKSHGQGIGLNLSRHIIEQMNGQLTLTNRADGVGACALIRLPAQHYHLNKTNSQTYSISKQI